MGYCDVAMSTVIAKNTLQGKMGQCDGMLHHCDATILDSNGTMKHCDGTLKHQVVSQWCIVVLNETL